MKHAAVFLIILMICSASSAIAQTNAPLTWGQVRQRFEQNNPELQAGELDISESKAQEITAYLRPNPQLTTTVDGTEIAPNDGHWLPLSGTFVEAGISYLHERGHKRELRLESAREGTAVTASTQADLKRTLLYNLRSAFVGALQAKAVLQLAKDNLAYWDHVLEISHDRFKAGDLAGIDLDRLELQRVQFTSDVQTAEVNLRTAKMQLLALLDDRTPVDQFDVTGPFDFNEQIQPLSYFQQQALENRPDLKAAMQTIKQAETNHKLAMANGTSDPTFSAWYTWNSAVNNPYPIDMQTVGGSVSIPLRIFDRNQGEKLRTQLDIERSERLLEARRAQVFSDVDSAYALVKSDLALLQPYKDKYLKQAAEVRDTVRLSYEHGAASLLDFLSAESDYRNIRLNYLNLIGSYLTAAAQLNWAVGREVIQ
jgi:cobalt-zinc-cadmium efflux system outer membrane protein